MNEVEKMKTEFLSIAAHQMRAPITAIKGYASLIQEGQFGPVPDEVKGAIDVIFESSTIMALMVDDFLNVSRIDHGKMRFHYTIADIAELTGEVVKEFKSEIEKKGLQIKFEYDHHEKYTTRIDVAKIKKAISNILDNAIKYTPSGSIRVIVEHDITKKKIHISIHDEGIGMSEEEMKKLFIKFNRAPAAISTNVHGSGLGLYIAKQMLEFEGGNIWATSNGEGKGSTFHIELIAIN